MAVLTPARLRALAGLLLAVAAGLLGLWWHERDRPVDRAGWVDTPLTTTKVTDDGAATVTGTVGGKPKTWTLGRDAAPAVGDTTVAQVKPSCDCLRLAPYRPPPAHDPTLLVGGAAAVGVVGLALGGWSFRQQELGRELGGGARRATRRRSRTSG